MLTRGQGDHWHADLIKFGGENLPQSAVDSLTQVSPFLPEMGPRGPFDYDGNWVEAYHERGSKPEEAKKWVLIMDNGHHYKHGAQYIVWFNVPENETSGKVNSKCYWDYSELESNINQLLRKGEMNRCRYYQT